jgi:hypothetical protein
VFTVLDKDLYQEIRDKLVKEGKYYYLKIDNDKVDQIFYMLQEEGLNVVDNVYQQCFELEV